MDNKKETLESYKLEVQKRDGRKNFWVGVAFSGVVFLVVGTIIGYFLAIEVITTSQHQAVQVIEDLAQSKQ